MNIANRSSVGHLTCAALHYYHKDFILSVSGVNNRIALPSNDDFGAFQKSFDSTKGDNATEVCHVGTVQV